jgi:toxin ParE1/3/4
MGENSGLDAAHRFLAEARASFLELAQTAHLGARRPSEKFPTLRMWRVRHFENYLIFYQPIPDGVQIERVIHAAQDYTRIIEPSPPG